MECVFCNQPEILERTIVETEFAKAFPTYIPIMPGHTLVIPKRCVRTMAELSADEKTELLALTEAIKRALVKAVGAEGFNTAWNEGEVAGQTVPHLHLHVVPRKTGDTGITQYDPRDFLYRPGSREPSPQAELLAVSKLIQANL